MFLIKKIYNNLKSKIYILIIIIFYAIKIVVLIVPTFDQPIVSIIIPVHNKFSYTYNCISSILNNRYIVPYEIIIADDLSTDLTRIAGKFIKNVKIIHNKKKYNFLINCNKASKIAKGKYIIFLNNDTKVNKDWLFYLFKVIESDEKIGIVGSKLIYPNGILQEAGGIVLNNGNCINYGNGKNKEMSEFNYIKEVDYISGASIMIRKSLWEQIDGFDKRYYPAYYEDTDLAFKIRKRGFKVIYQPKSVVIHYEGISNGKDINSGIKYYQTINRKKFIEKWKNELQNQLDSKNIFISRDRSYNKSRILVIDNSVPFFDKNAGDRCTFMYLNLFKEIGLQVTFIGDNFKKVEPYTSFLQQNYIEVLYGKIYNECLDNWFKNNLQYYNYVYLQRPEIAIKHIYSIKKYFNGKIIYYGHDLHYIRKYREFNIVQDQSILKQAEIFEKIESEIFSNVDIIHTVGNYEFNILNEKYSNKIIRNIPLFFYEKQITTIEKDFSKRKNMIFVGSVCHSPNSDAIYWFYNEIFPKIVKQFPEIILFIVGKKDKKMIKKMNSVNIKFVGNLADEDLQSLYQNCRIAIAPLRFGAGVKGKIIEAAYNQIPMITTSIGGEGLDNSTGAFIIEDNPKKMSEIICTIYNDYAKLKQMSDSGKIFIEKYFSKEKAKEIIMQDIK